MCIMYRSCVLKCAGQDAGCEFTQCFADEGTEAIMLVDA